MIHIEPIQQSIQAVLAAKTYTQIVVVVDNHTKKYCYPLVKPFLPKHTLISILAGESNKILATCEQIWQSMTKAQLDRHALVLNLGGGVIGDMGGFCAATYKRGIDFVQIPTTLLSQVDASVGGKLGIDFNGLKNHLGVFTLPKSVLIDAVFLKTLPEREIRSGFAEIIKHCLIADAKKWQEIRVRDFDEQNFEGLIAHSVEIKKKIVEQDPTEKGIRKTLNFGHTLGHAIETHFLNDSKKRLLHGEAIAAGMICESFIAHQRKLIDVKTLEQIEEFIFSIYGNANIKNMDIEPIIALTAQDKKNLGKSVRFSLIDGLGSCQFDLAVSNKEMKAALNYYIG